MSPTPQSSQQDQSKGTDQALETAYAWLLRLQSEKLSREERADFTAWYAEAVEHRRAYDQALAHWHDPALGVALLGRRRQRQHARLGRYLLLACSILVGLQQLDPVTRWQADRWTAVGELAFMQLADGSTLRLNTATAIAVEDTPSERRIRLLHGEIYCEVKPDALRPFVVLAPRSRTRVLGTGFSVRADPEDDTISVVHGAVTVNDRTGGTAPRRLRPREQIQAYPAGLSPIRAVADPNLPDWIDNHLAFEQVPLQQVLARLQRYWRGYVYFRDESLRGYKISGRYNLRDPAAIIDVLAQTLPIKFTRLTPWLVIVG